MTGFSCQVSYIHYDSQEKNIEDVPRVSISVVYVYSYRPFNFHFQISNVFVGHPVFKKKNTLKRNIPNKMMMMKEKFFKKSKKMNLEKFSTMLMREGKFFQERNFWINFFSMLKVNEEKKCDSNFFQLCANPTLPFVHFQDLKVKWKI
mgnify:CR=1 FL=1